MHFNKKRPNRGENSQEPGRFDRGIYNLLLVGLLVIPLTIRTAIVKVYGPLIQSSTLENSLTIDFFNYYKFVLLIMLSIAVSVIFIVKIITERHDLRADKFTAFLAVLYIAVLISLALADYKSLALYGHLYEGSLSYICYMLIFFVCLNMRYDIDRLKNILNVFTVVVVINAALGLLNYYGVNVLQYPLINALLTSDFAALESGTVSSTYNNPNYASGISAVFFMMFFTMTLLESSKRRWYYLGVACLSFATLLSALSTSGFFTIVVMIPLTLVLLMKKFVLKKMLAPAFILVIICSAIYYPLSAHNPRLYKETFGFFAETVKKITLSNRVAYAAESGGYERIKSKNRDAALEEVFGLSKPEASAGSGRLRIWDNTLKLIKKRPIFGYGLGTMILYYDNNDPDQAFRGNIVSKPHNVYLGLAFGTGLIGLLAFLALVISHSFDFFKELLIKKRKIHPVHLSLFIGIGTYLIQALFNDSVIGMSVIFWIIFGVSAGLLRQETQVVIEGKK